MQLTEKWRRRTSGSNGPHRRGILVEEVETRFSPCSAAWRRITDGPPGQARGPIRKEIESGEITRKCWWERGGTHGSIPTAWNLRGYPTVHVLDHQRVIRLKFTGHLASANSGSDGPQPPIDAFIGRLLGEKWPDAGALATVVVR